MTQSTAEINKRYNEKMPVVSFRVTQETKSELERVCKHLETDPANLLKGVLKEYVLSFSGLQKSIREQKTEAVSLEQLRERVSEYLSAGGDFYAARAMFEQFRRQLNERENQKKVEGNIMGKQKSSTKRDIARALELSRKILKDGGASLEDHREAATVFLAAGGTREELAQLAKGQPPATAKTADEIKAEMLAKSNVEQDLVLSKARGWIG